MYAVVTDTKNKGGNKITMKIIFFQYLQWYDSKYRFFANQKS